MKRHHITAATTIRAGNVGRALERVARQTVAASNENTTEQRITLSPRFTRRETHTVKRDARRPASTHTLVLVGRLDRASTHTLEAEIERLCEAEITRITLDLSELTGIDTAGVAVIAFRAKWCTRRGCELELIAGSSAVQHAFELAGVLDALPFKEASPTTTS